MYYDITGADPIELVKAAYRHSSPQGLGFLHFEEGDLSHEEAEKIACGQYGIRMDYVKGRACKLSVIERDDKMFIPARWYDHSGTQLQALLRDIGMSDAPIVESIPE